MSIPIPLAVRLRTARTDRHITADLRDLWFRSTVPGGFASARLSLNRPLGVQPDEIAYYGRVYVYDTRNGNTVWEGRLEDPGRSAGDGEVWQLTAVGPSAHARDRTVPLIYVDQALIPWIRVDNVTPGGTFIMGTDPGKSANPDPIAQSLVFQFPQGLGVVANSRVTARYDQLRLFGQKLARYDYTWDAGVTNASLLVQGVTRLDGSGTGENSRSEGWSTSGGASSPKVIGTDWTAGRNTLDLRIINNGGSSTIGNDDTWAAFSDIVVLATRYNKSGTELLTGTSYPNNYVTSDLVVADLLGRLLDQYDGANASIATGSHHIDKLAYPDGANPEKVLADLMTLEPAFFWAAWESDLTSDLYRFEWAAWPTSVRYEATAVDGYDGPGSADGLYNRVRVRWRGPAGEVHMTLRTQTVPELTAADLEREAIIDLGDEVGSEANAEQAGDEFLAEHKAAPNAGRLIIARPVRDLTTGRLVDPWEIRPGELIRVRGILPRVDALNATARDGVTVFKIASHEYSASSASAALELDSFSLSTARALADLQRRVSYVPRRR